MFTICSISPTFVQCHFNVVTKIKLLLKTSPSIFISCKCLSKDSIQIYVLNLNLIHRGGGGGGGVEILSGNEMS